MIDEGTPTNPSFTIRWREGSRRRGKRGYKTVREAQEALARIRAGRADGVLEARRPTTLTFTKAGKEWLMLHSKPNLRSHDDNQERWDNHVCPFFGDIPLVQVTPTRILEFRAHLQAKKTALAPATINRCLALVRSVLKFAVVAGHIPASPTDAVGRGKLMLKTPHLKLAPPFDNVEEVGRLLAVTEQMFPRLHGLIATALYTGMRKGELCGLHWRDVDTKRKFITVRRSYDGLTKSGKTREVPIPPELAQILAQHRLACPFKGELAFPDDAGEMMSTNVRLQRPLAKALEKAELRTIRFHDLRHAYASFYLMAGGTIVDLQRNLGHSTPVLTTETYGHLSPDHRVKEAARISFPVATKAKILQVGGDAT